VSANYWRRCGREAWVCNQFSAYRKLPDASGVARRSILPNYYQKLDGRRKASSRPELCGLAERFSHGLGLELHEFGARNPNEFDQAFAAITKARVDALMVLGDPTLVVHKTRIIDFAAKHHLPAIYGTEDHAEAGGLITYGPDYAAQYGRGAFYVDKILKGAKPADLPVEQPTKFELAINLKTVTALGLTIPPMLLVRADKVIE